VTFIFLLRREVKIIPDSTPTFLRHPEDLATLASLMVALNMGPLTGHPSISHLSLPSGMGADHFMGDGHSSPSKRVTR
jgi:hypothetical protein